MARHVAQIGNETPPKDGLHICMLANQVGAFGKIGGFGTGVRGLGRELVKLGHQVTVIVPRQEGQSPKSMLDGMVVIGADLKTMLGGVRTIRNVNADIYHSHEPTWHTVLAQIAAPNAVHVVTSIDPRPFCEILTELKYSTHRRKMALPRQWFYEWQPLIRLAVKRAHAVITPAPTHLRQLTMQHYRLDIEPEFVPTAYLLTPESFPLKDERPTFAFVGRWDRRKRVNLFFKIAEQRPEYTFIAVGRAHEKAEDARLRALASRLENVEIPGFMSVFDSDLWDTYDRAWAIINTSPREGLPLTFFEALSRGCLIVSSVNPEGYATRFGYAVSDGDLKEYLGAVDAVAREGGDTPRAREAFRYANATFQSTEVASQHESLYRRLMIRMAN